MPKTPLPKISIPLCEESKAALKRLADAQRRPLAAYARIVLENHLQRKGAK